MTEPLKLYFDEIVSAGKCGETLNGEKVLYNLLIRLIFSFIVGMVFISCQNSKNETVETEIPEPKYYTPKEKDSVYKVQALEKLSIYNPITDWDTSYIWTYKLKEKVLDSVIYFDGSIKDITKIRDRYILKTSSSRGAYMAELTLDRFIVDKIQSLYIKKPSQRWAFVFKVKDIISMSPELTADGEAEGSGENEAPQVHAYLVYDYSQTLRQFKGELIDFYLIKAITR